MIFASPSGLSGLLIDAKEFLAAVRVARPILLTFVFVLPILALLNRHAANRRRQAIAEIGRLAAVGALNSHPISRYRWLGFAYPLAWLALVLGIAGLRWGKSDESGVAVGRDLVVVVDLSRSMQAEDMNAKDAKARWQSAKLGLLNLMDAIAARGGHRIAIVVFAARPKLACPLTTDYEHVRAVIQELDGGHPPPECRPPRADAVSGTRIGAGLIAAVEAHDTRFPGSQDIILLSDGDDPGEDEEWRRGIFAARKAGIPVHVVGLGDPEVPTPLLVGDPMNPDFVGTKLMEVPLKAIAAGDLDDGSLAETHGEYLSSQRDVPPLGEFFRTRIEPSASRVVSDDAIPQPKERYAWFFAPALLLFSIGWIRGK